MKHSTIFGKNIGIHSVASKKNLVSRAIKRLAVRRATRQTIRKLNGLPDRLLRDIGIERYEIARAVKNPSSYARLLKCKTEQASNLARLKIAA